MEQFTVGPNKYTVLVTNLERNLQEQQIKEIFEGQEQRRIQVVKVNMVYKIDFYLKLIEEFTKLYVKQRIIQEKYSLDTSYKEKFDRVNLQVFQLLSNIFKEKDKLQIPDTLQKQFTGDAFITFQFQN